MKLDIISSVFGNKEVVEQCVESWYPVPKDWTVNLYNNKKSDEDGTTEMLKEKIKVHNFSMLSENVNLKHAEALNKLISATSSEWILMLDSDAYLKDKKFYSWVETAIQDSRIFFWAPNAFYPTYIMMAGFPQLPTYFIGRGSWIMIINRNFIEKYSLDPNPMRIEGKIIFGKIQYKNNKNQIDRTSPETVHVTGDVGWQYRIAAMQLNKYKIIPDDMVNCWHHVKHASCDPTRKLIFPNSASINPNKTLNL